MCARNFALATFEEISFTVALLSALAREIAGRLRVIVSCKVLVSGGEGSREIRNSSRGMGKVEVLIERCTLIPLIVMKFSRSALMRGKRGVGLRNFI